MCKKGDYELINLPRKPKPAEVDKCLAPLIKILNECGIETWYCCCEHGSKSKIPYIMMSAKHVNSVILLTEKGKPGHITFRFPVGWTFPRKITGRWRDK